MLTVPAPPGRSAPAPAHRLDAQQAQALLGVQQERGLSAADAADRQHRFGANELDAAPRVPAWRRLAAQFTDLLILILIAAAVVAFVVSGELKTPLVGIVLPTVT